MKLSEALVIGGLGVSVFSGCINLSPTDIMKVEREITIADKENENIEFISVDELFENRTSFSKGELVTVEGIVRSTFGKGYSIVSTEPVEDGKFRPWVEVYLKHSTWTSMRQNDVRFAGDRVIVTGQFSDENSFFVKLINCENQIDAEWQE